MTTLNSRTLRSFAMPNPYSNGRRPSIGGRRQQKLNRRPPRRTEMREASAEGKLELEFEWEGKGQPQKPRQATDGRRWKMMRFRRSTLPGRGSRAWAYPSRLSSPSVACLSPSPASPPLAIARQSAESGDSGRLKLTNLNLKTPHPRPRRSSPYLRMQRKALTPSFQLIFLPSA